MRPPWRWRNVSRDRGSAASRFRQQTCRRKCRNARFRQDRCETNWTFGRARMSAFLTSRATIRTHSLSFNTLFAPPRLWVAESSRRESARGNGESVKPLQNGYGEPGPPLRVSARPLRLPLASQAGAGGIECPIIWLSALRVCLRDAVSKIARARHFHILD